MTQAPPNRSAVSDLQATDRERIIDENARLHADLARDYDRIHPHIQNSYEQYLQRRDVERMVKASGSSGVSVLELGCGTGNLTMQFIDAGCSVLAVDLSAEMLSELERKVRVRSKAACEFQNADVDRFLVTDTRTGFHVVAMSSVAHHLPDYRTSLEALARRLAHGGFLYLIHEPVHRAELARSLAPLRHAWSVLPRGLNRLLNSVHARTAASRDWETRDTTYVDYHYHLDGISVASISDSLESLGVSLVDVSHYNAHDHAIPSWLDNYWCPGIRFEQFQRTYFRAIWRRNS